MSVFITIVIFLFMFCIMVAVHELGHYLVGRKFGLGVHEFSVGIGRPIVWRWKRKRYQLPDGEPTHTDFNLRAWPIGGFVRFHGQEPLEDGSEVHVNGGIYSISPGKRWLILFAGPLFSIIFGVIVLVGQFSLVGSPEPSTQLATVDTDKPAYKAGLRPGDRITEVAGKKIKDTYETRMTLQENGTAKSIPVSVLRNNEKLTFNIVPILSEMKLPILDKDGLPTGKEAQTPIIGVTFGTELVRQPFGQAFMSSVELPFLMAQRLAYNISRPKVMVEESRGVIGMVEQTHNILQEQALQVITWCGLISISLGIMNLLPIGMLDGGQMLIAVAEMLRGGRRLPFKIQMQFLTVGTLIVLGFMVFVNGRDLFRLIIPSEKPASTAQPSAPSTNQPAPSESKP